MPYNNLDLTPTQVARELLDLGRELADCTTDLEQLEVDAVRAQEKYDLRYSQEIIVAGEDPDLGSADKRKAYAFKETTNERLDAKVADAKVKARKTRIDVLKTRVTIGQSVATALRSELDLDGLRRR